MIIFGALLGGMFKIEIFMPSLGGKKFKFFFPTFFGFFLRGDFLRGKISFKFGVGGVRGIISKNFWGSTTKQKKNLWKFLFSILIRLKSFFPNKLGIEPLGIYFKKSLFKFFVFLKTFLLPPSKKLFLIFAWFQPPRGRGIFGRQNWLGFNKKGGLLGEFS